ncbi:SseB family protein [Eubacterium oxidoreducens]|uniref:SseB protein N-terminal domain-containing protein n=1 Tax=Eubacterium oxidoreducens TaxID=1732 RepID=A0A1G6ABY2_EUBOX|nr:SseB family protein [Eubacterium oxidoreducens]SDB05912.1 SseB protein N-terminal domain-containing protein [Eubacterium oxidoreducens]
MEAKTIKDVDNGKLETLLEEFSKNQKKEVMNQIVPLLGTTRVLMQANFPPEFDRNQLKDAKQGQAIKLPKGVKPVPAILKSNEGGHFFGVYTGHGELPKENKFPFVLDMKFSDCCKLAQNAKLEGIVVNAFSHNVTFKKPAIDAFVKEFAQGKVPVVPGKEVKMTPEQFHDITRRSIELHLLPKILFEQKEKGFDSICEGGEGAICEIFSDPYKKVKGLESPYKSSDFSVMDLNITQDLGLIRIDLPQKNARPGHCKRVYITYSFSLDLIQYYTIHVPKPNEESMLGCVIEIEEGKTKHEILEPAPNESAEMQKVMELSEQIVKNRI